MLTNNALALVDEVFNEAVMTELRDPKVCAKNLRKEPQKKTLVAGLTVLSSNVEDNTGALEKRRKRLRKFRLDREEASLDLMEAGIKPLGIVPVVALEKLFDGGGLIRLCPNADGKVHIQTSKAVLEALSKGSLSAKETCGVVFPRNRSPEKSECCERVKHRGYYDERNKTYDRRAMVRVAFPEPPADVQKVLHAARAFQLKVAAVPEAITFLDDLTTVVSAKLKRVAEQKAADERRRAREEARRRAIDDCPIVYIEFGTAAAVIAQFGDFAIEKKIVEAIASSQYLV